MGIMFPRYCVSLLLHEDTAKITAVLHGDDSAMGDNLDDIFKHKLPRLNKGKSNKIITLSSCSSTQLPSRTAMPSSELHLMFYKEWLGTILAAEKMMCKKLKAQLAIIWILGKL
jgi:hypothetical protein